MTFTAQSGTGCVVSAGASVNGPVKPPRVKAFLGGTDGFKRAPALSAAVPEFPDVVRAPPERVWQALADPEARRRGGFILEATLESGRAGTADAVALYRTKRGAWRERVLESDPPRRLLVEQRDAATDRTRATMGWRLEPIQMGSLLVLEVQGKGFGEAVTIWAWRKRWYRKLVEAVKRASEASEETPPAPAPDVPPAPEAAPVAKPEPQPASKAPKKRAPKKK
jgi:uncharacterized protein YndB with AHSA1/START domain